MIKATEFAYGPYGRQEWMPLRLSAGGLELDVEVDGNAFTRDQVQQLLSDVVEIALRRDRACKRQDGWVRGEEWTGAMLGIVEKVMRECAVPKDAAQEIEERVRGYLRHRSEGYFSV